MSSKIRDIADKLDKKPIVILNILKDMGVESPNMNTVLTDDLENRLLIKMGLKKKEVPQKKVVEEVVEDDSHVKKTVIVRRKKTVILKKKEEPVIAKKMVAKKKEKTIPEKPKATVTKKKVDEVEKPTKTTKVSKTKKATETTKTKEVKEVKEVKDSEKVKEVTPAKKVTVTKKAEAPKHINDNAKDYVVIKKANEPPKKPKTTVKKPEEEVRRYVKIDKDEINRNRRYYGKGNNNNNNKPTTNRPTYNRPNNNQAVGRPQTDNRGPQRRPGQTTDKKEDKPDTGIKKITKTRGKNIKKDFNKSYNKTDKKTSKTQNKNQKYRSQTFVPGQKLGVNEVLSEEFIFNEYYSNDNIRKRRKKNKDEKRKIEVLTNVKLPETMTVKFFAETVKKQVTDVIMKLMSLDIMASINDEIDFDTASLIAGEYKIDVELEMAKTEEDILFDDTEDEDDDLETRPPVVVIMGHVDHGKTSLLDTIKETNVVDTEAGNITQHIGAYMVDVNDRKITFLDTPGHEAFTSMRKRGAQVTDIAIIVIAADDGIMPQTIEAINHAKAAEVSIIIAINKIDVRGANVEKVKQELTEHGLIPEEWGGETVCVPVSAKTGENVDGLLEMITLTADMLELKANPNKQAKGTVVEARVEKSGVIATVLVQRGTLKVGDAVISGTSTGRVRAMTDDRSNTIDFAGPSVPTEILGLDEAPSAGDEFYAVQDLKTAKSLAERRRFEQFQDKNKRKATSLEDLFAQIQEGQIKDLNIIVKGDVRGSVEAVTESLMKISNEEVQVKVIHGAVGTIIESDITLAEVSNAIIIGFNVRPNAKIIELAKETQVDIRLYRIIYKAIEDIEAAIKGMLAPKFIEVVKGHAEIRDTFKVSGIGTIAGCMVTDGKIERNTDIRVLRDGIIIYEGKLSSLKRFKDDAKEVASGYECGMSVEKYNDLKIGDVIEAYSMEEIEN